MITPDYLKEGDKIAIISTARKISYNELKPSINEFESWGLEVVLGDNIFAEDNQFAGTAEQRAADLQKMLDDENIKAVVCARGGYGTVQTIDQIDFEKFIEKPKWIIGYSDVTVLHSHLNRNIGVESIHAIMPVNFKEDAKQQEDVQKLKELLFGGNLRYKIPIHKFTRIKNNVEAELVGGNLSILYSLLGSDSDIDSKSKVLFFEELDEYLYHIDRMMMNLKRNKYLEKPAAILIGGMTDMNDNKIPFGKNAEEIVNDFIAESSYPVIFGFPAGHISPNMPLVIGRNIKISKSDKFIEISQ